MENTIARQNSDRLTALTVAFCLINRLNMDDVLCKVIALTVMAHIAKWYEDNEREFHPDTELIEDEAIKYAFGKVQEIANLAAIEAQTGIGMEGLDLGI